MQMARQTLDMQIFKKVVFIREIPGRPYQARGCNLGARFGAQLHFPLDSVLVADVELGVGALHVFLNESKCSTRLMARAARSVNQIARCDVGRIAPESRLRVLV